MRIALFCHSLLSDWNHGNAHFLRGVVSELVARRHSVVVYEPGDAWSLQNLVADHGEAVLEDVRKVYPALDIVRYQLRTLPLAEIIDGSDLVIVHEWSAPELVAMLGRLRRDHRFILLFHDTHHRSVSAPDEMERYDLTDYDGVLAFGRLILDLYLKNGWARRGWVWHEAADTRVFFPSRETSPQEGDGDLVWIGNWGDDERSDELREFLLEPVRRLRLRARVHGVRYPERAREALAAAGIAFGGWLPNFEVPSVFARYRLTVHVPRRHYARSLPGIPTIRPFEALACGIPLVSAPWDDIERLFSPGLDYLVARDGEEMTRQLRRLLEDPARAHELAETGRRTLLARHTCRHRVDELLSIAGELGAPVESGSPSIREPLP